MFCYCPLYFIKECGGNPKYYKGVKDCSDCTVNHDENSYEHVNKILKEVFGKIQKNGKMIYLSE
jgi:Zn-finger protein